MTIKYSLILPCYNEYGNLKLLLPEILKNLSNNTFEIIIVDDNSEDGTISRLKEVFKNEDRIKYILREKDRGLGESIKEGILKSSGENIVVMDSDCNHRTEDLGLLINEFNKEKFDMVCGSRFLKGGSSTTFFRHVSSLIFNIFINLITNGKLSDNMSGFFIIKKKYLQEKLDKIFYGYGEFYIRLLFFMQKERIKISEIPVRYGPRRYGYSKSKLIKMSIIYTVEAIKLIK